MKTNELPRELLNLIDPIQAKIDTHLSNARDSHSWLWHFSHLPPASFITGISYALLQAFDLMVDKLPNSLSLKKTMRLMEIKHDVDNLCKYIQTGDNRWLEAPTHDKLFQELSKALRSED